ncbi:MAG: 2-oxoglutarate dehydrogenase complex dihydrolipoyllysine-residue succinyltransferase [Phaeodactylibacter sp.]|uniref:2-oxoglutarate dehydrogenase complex dihydrolipoyllysine-residue succinyltransferase n=1 Tax=Phaeodactylibacter sp. TaxID=1940289 RepID=UPI0032F09BCF
MSVVEMKVPTIGESVTEVTLSQWLIADGDYVELDQPICEFESDKATLEFPAEASGKLIHVAAEDDDLEIGALVAKIDTSVSKESGGGDAPKADAPAKEEAPKPETATSAPAEASENEDSYAAGHPSPAAAKILKENNIDPKAVKGTGKDGRITKEDAQKAVEAKKQAPAPSPAPAKETPKKEDAPKQVVFSSAKDFSRETSSRKMSRMRRTIAKRLVSAKNETAMLTTFNEVDLTEVMKLRKTYQDRFVEKYGIKLGFMSLFAKACAKALMEMPDVNAKLDGDNLVHHDYADISIAVSTPNGLVVPPVHNAESLSFAEIEYKIKELATKARNGNLTLEEMSGGTFTITNGGIFGSLLSTPILNEPQSAILGMHGIKNRPMAIDGEVKIRPMMYLALSYDHRVVDGSTSVTFLVKVKEYIEDPVSMLLDL